MERAEGEYKVINEIFRSEAAKRPGRVFYVDIYSMFLDGSGNYADYLDTGGGLVKVRGDDGIHFTRDGGNKVAGEIFKVLADNFDLTSSDATTSPRPRPPGAAGPAGSPARRHAPRRPPPATVGPGGPAVP